MENNVTEDNINNSDNSHSPSGRLPSLRKRLKERLEEPIYLKQTKLLELRKIENQKKKEETNEDKIKFDKENQKRKVMLDRLAILGNISIGANQATSPTSIKNIWKAHDSVVHSVKNALNEHPKIMLSELNSIEDKEEFKDSIDMEICRSPAALSNIRYDKLHNQLSLMSQVDNNDSILDVLHSKGKQKRSTSHKKHYMKKSRRKKNMSAIPKTIENILAKKISSINPNFDDAFKFYEKDIHELAEDPLIKKKLEKMNDFASPQFLIGLKKKQRMNEYWKNRIRKDFTKLNKDSDDEYATDTNIHYMKDNQAITKLVKLPNQKNAKGQK